MKTTHSNLALLVGCILIVSFCVSDSAGLQKNGITTTKGGSCLYDPNEGVVDNCILRDQSGRPFIAPAILRNLSFDRYGLVPVHSEENLWMYVNRQGKVVISGVPSFDNWADDFSDGLVRTIVNGKYGFANRHGKIVIDPQFDWASPFRRGYAEGCNHCRERCADGTAESQSTPSGCEHRVMTGGEWFKIDKKGRTTTRLPSH